MRVLMVSKACLVGTYQKKLEEMVARAPDLSLTVLVPPSWRDKCGTVTLERVHTTGYNLKVHPLAFNGSFHTHFYPRLGRAVASLQPDLVHIDEEPYNFATYHANRLARRHGVKTLWFSWQNLVRNYPPPFSWMEQYNLQHSDYAVMGSQTAAAVWQAKGYTGPFAVIPQFGVDPERFCPPVARPHDRPVHIAYVGRLVPEKGVDLLLDALGHVGGTWHATLLGSGPMEAALREQVAALGLTERVTFCPWLASTKMPAFYQTIDILVLPSRARPNWTEQFGRVLIEAMAAEVAVVGSDVGEIPYVIEDAGRIFPEDDAEALAQLLDELVRMPELRREMGVQGRQRVLDRFTQQHIADATIAVYRQMIA